MLPAMRILLLAIGLFASQFALAGDPIAKVRDRSRPQMPSNRQDPQYASAALQRAQSIKAQVLEILRKASNKVPNAREVYARLRATQISAHDPALCNQKQIIAQEKAFVYDPDKILICPIFNSITDRFALHILTHESVHLYGKMMGECDTDQVAHVLEYYAGLEFAAGGPADEGCGGVNSKSFFPVADSEGGKWLEDHRH